MLYVLPQGRRNERIEIMALIKCKECGHEISDKANVCPKCGNKIVVGEKKEKSTIKIICAIVLVALIACGAFLFLNKRSEEKSSVAESGTNNAVEASEFDRSKAKLLKVVNVEYSNNLAAQEGNTYEAKNLCDSDSTTAWAVNLDNEAIYDCDMLYGPVFTVKCKKLSHIIIRNGYCKNEDSFKNNTRAAKIVFYSLVDDKEESREIVLFDGALRDKPTPQRLEIPLDLDGNNDIKQIGMNFNTQLNGGYYAGKKWNDLCISEVEFWGFE